MKKWIRKSFVVLVSILSFGIVTPSHAFLADNQTIDKAEQRTSTDRINDKKEESESGIFLVEDSKETLIGDLMKAAEEQSYEKFGTKISPVIENEFKDIVLPNIQKAIEMTINQYPEEDLTSLAITEKPSGGNGEKIFNIYNEKTNQDVIRFHVRRDHPPLDGYYFNFHYHTHHDGFQDHYDLGMIYWDKNTPPKWMAV
ncbi:YpjP family protein [Falsibacillus albus]|uniref:Cell division protein FtsK n=1 Tax=Falsibacillus albus TaxID=2478915 RepID=A0A3L7JWE4_9BACI|nr:YpjP family protein [Falsibacillus albus]RLQ95177.1 hypothetical protein D9X91_11830 [Falsibacillus albus]